MFGFSAKLPISNDERQWVDDGFRRLEKLLGRRRMLEARIVLPTPEDFPDPYDKSPAAAETLFRRVCSYMGVDCAQLDFEVFPDETEELSHILPHWRSSGGQCAAGLYFGGGDDDETQPGIPDRQLVAVRSTQLEDPMTLVATIAHELGHVILLGGKLMHRTSDDHEPMTDLLTVFLGFGIFSANSAGRFRQYQKDNRIGWSMKRLGYLAEEIYGYALAKFMLERGERNPSWIKHLSTNVRAYCKKSRIWLAENPQYVELPKSIG